MDNPNQTTQDLSPIPPVSPVVQTPPVSNPLGSPEHSAKAAKSKLPILIIGIILFLLIAGSAAGFYVFKQQSLKTTVKPTPSPVLREQTPTITPDPTANWKTYTNPLGKYSLSYPPDSLIQVSEARNQKVTQDTGFFRRIIGDYVYGPDTPVSFDISLNTEPPSDLTEDAHCNRITKSKTSINSVPADKIISEYGISPDCYNGSIAPPFSKIVYITFIHNNSMFKIRYGLEYFGGGIKEEVFAQMLSTFKFTQ